MFLQLFFLFVAENLLKQKILKQKLHAPLPVEKQVLILYALTHGFLDTIPVNRILEFETSLFDFIESQHAELLTTIRTTKDLPSLELLDEAIQTCSNQFLAASINAGSTQAKLAALENV